MLYREIRQRVDTFLMANKDRIFSIEEIAREVGPDDVRELQEALNSSVRCAFTKCQSFDTALTEKHPDGFEVHHCFRCDRGTQIQRDAKGYTVIGWYGE